MSLAEERNVAEAHRSWTHQGHIADKHIPELRQFIERSLTEKSSERSDSRISPHFEDGTRSLVQVLQALEQSLSILDHSAKFNKTHFPSTVAVALLDEKHRTWTAELDGTCNQ